MILFILYGIFAIIQNNCLVNSKFIYSSRFENQNKDMAKAIDDTEPNIFDFGFEFNQMLFSNCTFV